MEFCSQMGFEIFLSKQKRRVNFYESVRTQEKTRNSDSCHF